MWTTLSMSLCVLASLSLASCVGVVCSIDHNTMDADAAAAAAAAAMTQ